MHVAVAIVGFRNAGDIVQCLGALERSTHADFEVTICENGGSAAYDTLKAAVPSVLSGGQMVRLVLASRNLGYAGGINLCLRETPLADAWWILNPDTCPRAEAMAALVERLMAGDCDAVGCTLYSSNGEVQLHGGLWRPWLARAVSIGQGASLQTTADTEEIERNQNYLSGASMMVGRRFLQRVGPMREDYFLYCEEIEWCFRASARGMRLGFAQGAQVLHAQGTTTGNFQDIPKRQHMPVYLDERNKMLITRDCWPTRLPVAALAAFALLFLRYARRGAWRQLGYGLSGWAAGLRNERGAPSWVFAKETK